MITYLIILLISFFLDGIMSNYFTSINLHISLFNTIYTVIALSCIANYFSNKKKYIILIGLTGLCFDIVYTNTFLLNVFIFIILGLNVILLNSKLPNNILSLWCSNICWWKSIGACLMWTRIWRKLRRFWPARAAPLLPDRIF